MTISFRIFIFSSNPMAIFISYHCWKANRRLIARADKKILWASNRLCQNEFDWRVRLSPYLDRHCLFSIDSGWMKNFDAVFNYLVDCRRENKSCIFVLIVGQFSMGKWKMPFDSSSDVVFLSIWIWKKKTKMMVTRLRPSLFFKRFSFRIKKNDKRAVTSVRRSPISFRVNKKRKSMIIRYDSD